MNSLNQDKAYFNIIIGDLNTKIGKKEIIQEKCMGDHEVEVRNERGQMLINYLIQNHLYAMNTFFNKKI